MNLKSFYLLAAIIGGILPYATYFGYVAYVPGSSGALSLAGGNRVAPGEGQRSRRSRGISHKAEKRFTPQEAAGDCPHPKKRIQIHHKIGRGAGRGKR